MSVYLVIDTETGGLDPQQHPLLEVGMVLFENGKEAGSFLERIVWNNSASRITIPALAVNNLDYNIGRSPSEAAAKIVNASLMFAKQKPILLGHNLEFDLGFINKLMVDHRFDGWLDLMGRNKIDTKQLALTMIEAKLIKPTGQGQIRTSLGDLAKYFQIKQDGAHTAFGDCITTWQIYQEMLKLLQNSNDIKMAVNTHG